MDYSKISDNELDKSLAEFVKSYVKNEPPAPDLSEEKLAGMIDHTILKPEASHSEVDKLCSEALKYKFASVCVNSSYVERCFNILKGSGIKVCSVIGFPLGSAAKDVKVFETEYAVSNGASEVDMVINIGELRSGNYEYVYNDIFSVALAAHNSSALLKVIIETCLLSDKEKAAACKLSVEAGADFVKTSTGFSKGGADIIDVALMKFMVQGHAKVKASGGIRLLQDALKMIAYGADRIGTSSGVSIIESFRNR